MSNYKVAIGIQFSASKSFDTNYESRQNRIARTVMAFLCAVTGLEPSELDIEEFDIIQSDRLDQGDAGGRGIEQDLL